jgi:hypothetical protein
MPRINVVDEAIIDSPPITVYKTFLNEWSGITDWWMPFLECKPFENMRIDHEGARFEITVHPKSRMKKTKFSSTVKKLNEAKYIEMELAGGVNGTMKITFEPINEKTKIQANFDVRMDGFLPTILNPFINIGKMHSEVMQNGFKACNNYLCSNK